MTTQQFFKGLFMVVVSIIVTAFSQVPVNWALLFATGLAALLAYVGKNLIPVFNSDSQPGTFSFVNFLSALLVALSTGVTEYVALIVVNGVVIWAVFWKVVLSVTFTYVGATFFAPPNSTSKKMFK